MNIFLAEGDLVTVTGWGKPSDNAGGISPVLRMVSDLPVITNVECNNIYGIVGPGVVCIDTTGGKGSCNVSWTCYCQQQEQKLNCFHDSRETPAALWSPRQV